MSFGTALISLLIGPLELFFQVVYALAYRVLHNPGLSIIFLSLAMNILVLPLYRQADKMQAAEREVELKLQPWVKRIKSTFKGDEQYMMLQTYYRQNNYKPTDSLKGSVSLLLEVPFFIAAYKFLSGLELLNGVSFGPILDLGSPDSLINAFGVNINILPIIMTLINFIAGAIYTKGFPLKSKIQLYGVAIIFLAFLYNSPSGLVFYWTLNNVFSLIKNIFYKLKNPKFVVCVISALIGFCALVYIIFVNPMDTSRRQAWMVFIFSLLLLPIVINLISKRVSINVEKYITEDNKSFCLGCVFISLFLGVLVPTSVLVSSPAEFINTYNYTNPLTYVLSSALLSVGTFVIWFGVFYILSNSRGKSYLGYIVFLISGIAIIDFVFFGKGLGNLSSTLQFDELPIFSMKEQFVNVFVLIIGAGLLFLIWKNKKSIVRIFFVSTILAVFALSILNVYKIQTVINTTLEKNEASAKNVATLSLSEHGKNVVVIMMDRAISSYVPFIFNENSELLNQFSGFTYYPNTVSFGSITNVASPALFGGYEYTPEEINKRDNESLESKQNESLKVLPVMFGREGYEVTVCDPPYAGYEWVPDLSIYDQYPYVSAYNTKGMVPWEKIGINQTDNSSLYRNLFCFSIFRVAPTVMQSILYNNGMYNDADKIAMLQSNHSISEEEMLAQLTSQTRDGLTKSIGYNSSFLNNYSVLCSMIDMTEITNNNKGSLILFQNETTHEPMMLQEPDYSIKAKVDNTGSDLSRTNKNGDVITFSSDQQVIHYQTNMASFVQIGAWLDYLKEKGVYDNTRIIIVSDHGRSLSQFETACVDGDYVLDYMSYNAVLLFKDFNSKESTICEDFMTVADVPTLATANVITNNKNPFTNKEISSETAVKSEVHVFRSSDWQVADNCGNTFNPARWYSVHDNIFDYSNWEFYDYKGN